ncbi:MerR family transcriptional regulator [candidate division KSB1 bacterium]|nr:MerR family transcriptional regulator [candidate division KSB1 bacterium]TDI90074.1 MAG: MerR family transcriptional regulator [Caldithrix sp.]TDJ03049.1 MAG: MerR family transcriptional regulator [Caldithrix sp.]
MPIEIEGKRFYRTNEALKLIGISKATWFRWLKEKKVEDVAHKDVRGWRLFTDEEVERIRKYANTINILPIQETLNF